MLAMPLTLHFLDNRKYSPTQPGQGIQRLVDLYHDVPKVIIKANKYSTIQNKFNPAIIEDLEKSDFAGMSKDKIEEERKE